MTFINQHPHYLQKLLRKYFGLFLLFLLIMTIQAPVVAKEKMVLAGSSSMARWTDANKVFKFYKVINKARGGTRVTDWLILYKKRIIKYKPDILLFYCGANDIQDGNGVSGIKNAENTIELLDKIQKKLKRVKIYYISINHCLKNPHAWNEIDISNKIMKRYCKREKRVYYVDIVADSLLPDGNPDPRLFKEDGIHPTKQGFKIWNKNIKRKVNSND